MIVHQATNNIKQRFLSCSILFEFRADVHLQFQTTSSSQTPVAHVKGRKSYTISAVRPILHRIGVSETTQ